MKVRFYVFMCTAITFEAEDFYFGRTLDYDFLYPSQVVIAPRNFDFGFENHLCEKEHYALTGMAYVHTLLRLCSGVRFRLREARQESPNCNLQGMSMFRSTQLRLPDL